MGRVVNTTFFTSRPTPRLKLATQEKSRTAAAISLQVRLFLGGNSKLFLLSTKKGRTCRLIAAGVRDMVFCGHFWPRIWSKTGRKLCGWSLRMVFKMSMGSKYREDGYGEMSVYEHGFGKAEIDIVNG